MDKSEQTPEILSQLHDLTVMFTKKLQPHYYYQFRGDTYDLAMDFFMSFITPKARGNNKKESLLDKWNPKILSLPALVKVSVIRKLIDQSRANPWKVESIEELLENHGDNFQLDIEEVNPSEFTPARINHIVQEYQKLEPEAKNEFFSKLYEIDSQLVKYLSPIIMDILGLPVQQITDKTIVLFVPYFGKCVNFSRFDGHAKGVKYPPIPVPDNLPDKYVSGLSRDSFEEYCKVRIFDM